MREFLRKKDMRKFIFLEKIKAGAKTPALTVRHIGIYRTVYIISPITLRAKAFTPAIAAAV